MVPLCSLTILAKSSSNESISFQFCTLDAMAGGKLQENYIIGNQMNTAQSQRAWEMMIAPIFSGKKR